MTITNWYIDTFFLIISSHNWSITHLAKAEHPEVFFAPLLNCSEWLSNQVSFSGDPVHLCGYDDTQQHVEPRLCHCAAQASFLTSTKASLSLSGRSGGTVRCTSTSISTFAQRGHGRLATSLAEWLQLACLTVRLWLEHFQLHFTLTPTAPLPYRYFFSPLQALLTCQSVVLVSCHDPSELPSPCPFYCNKVIQIKNKSI